MNSFNVLILHHLPILSALFLSIQLSVYVPVVSIWIWEMGNLPLPLVANRPKEGERKTEEANTNCQYINTQQNDLLQNVSSGSAWLRHLRPAIDQTTRSSTNLSAKADASKNTQKLSEDQARSNN